MQVFSSIYKARNKINGKIYIGVDSDWPNRKHSHKHNALIKNLDYTFYRAIRLYGWENFEWEVLYEHWDGQYTLNVLEPYFIDVYQSFGPTGYNMTKGGDGVMLGRTHSHESKEKISIAHKGRIISNVTKEKMSKAATGKHFSSEHRKNISISKSKKYLLIDPQGNEYKIQNISKFCRDNPQHNLSSPNLSKVANGKIPHYKNWKCFYFNPT